MSETQTIDLAGFHHIELWVGNAKQAAFFYRKAFGFSQLAYSGLETGARDRTSYLLGQGDIRLVLTSPMSDAGPIGDHIRRHGDGARDVAFGVKDVDSAFALAIARGAEPAIEPVTVSDDNGSVRRAAIKTYGETIHSFIDDDEYRGPFLPGFVEQRIDEPSAGLAEIDHVVGNVELGKMDQWSDFYADVLGFERYISFDDKDISTEYTALMSVVMSDSDRVVKFPINEPAKGRGKSQIQEYLEYYGGPGVQHVAMRTDDIALTIRRLRDNGIAFLDVPDAYYEDVPARIGTIDESLEEMQALRVLLDRDDEGYLLQLFTEPVQDRPTLFFEIIQRKGARGFGKGNFKALFESIEREQARRGNL